MHRVTQWRRKKRKAAGARVKTKLGRRLQEQQRRVTTLRKVVKLIDESRRATRIDYEDLTTVNWLVRDSVGFRAAESGLHSDLLAVAVCDALNIGTRRRAQSVRLGHEAEVLAREGMSPAEIEKALQERPAWLPVVLARVKEEAPVRNDFGMIVETVSLKRCCPSKIFKHLSRRMVAYWRAHPKYDIAVALVNRLAA